MTAPTVSLDVVAQAPFLDVNSVQYRDRLRYRGQARTIADTADPIVRPLVRRLVRGEVTASSSEGGNPR